MSWPLRMILFVTTLNIILQLYIFIDLSYTFKILFEKYKKKLKIFLLILIVYLNSLPIIIIIYYAFNNTRNIFLASNTLSWLDYLVTYPFWWGLRP